MTTSFRPGWIQSQNDPIEGRVRPNVVLNCVRSVDDESRAAIGVAKNLRHIIVVCERLLNEYRRSLVGGGPRHLFTYYDRMVMQILPSDLLERKDDPSVLIQFGPEEDRFHMQLAIDEGCGFHVSWDKGVLAEVGNIGRFGVAEVNPPGYVAANS